MSTRPLESPTDASIPYPPLAAKPVAPPPAARSAEPALAPARKIRIDREELVMEGDAYTESQVVSVIESAYPALEACYAPLLLDNPDAEGVYVLGVVVDTFGEIMGYKGTPGSTLDDKTVVCMDDVARTLPFRKAKKTKQSVMTVRARLRFTNRAQ